MNEVNKRDKRLEGGEQLQNLPAKPKTKIAIMKKTTRIQPTKKSINDVQLNALYIADHELKGITSAPCAKARKQVQLALSDLALDLNERHRQIVEKIETGHGKRVKLSKAMIFAKIRKAVEATILALANVRSEQAVKTRERLVAMQGLVEEMYEQRKVAIAAKYTK